MFNLFHNYLTRGFWGDEAWTSLISQLPYFQMLKTTAADFHPPGYYTLVELLYLFLPKTEVVTRLISLFFWLMTILMVYLLAKKFNGRTFGLYSAIVVTLNPIFFTYAFEARNYTMFAFAATTSIYFLLRVCEKFSFKNVIFFILFTALGLYTHYYMLFILGAQGIYILVCERKILLKMIAVYLGVVLLFMPWIPFLYGQLTSVSHSYWIGSINSSTHYEALQRILAGENDNAFKPYLFYISAALLIIGFLYHVIRRNFEKPYVLIWLWAVVPFILASLPGLDLFGFKLPFRPIFFWRYLIGASVPFSMVIVHAAQRLNDKWYKTCLLVVILLSLIIDVLNFSRYPETFKQIYQENIIGKIQPTDKIVTILPSFAEVLYYRNYFGLRNEIIVLPEGLVQFSGKSLLDSYVTNGVVKIQDRPSGGYFELSPGPTFKYIDTSR